MDGLLDGRTAWWTDGLCEAGRGGVRAEGMYGLMDN